MHIPGIVVLAAVLAGGRAPAPVSPLEYTIEAPGVLRIEVAGLPMNGRPVFGE